MDNVTGLALARIAIGAGFWAAPETALKLGLLDPKAPQSPYLGRMFGAREIALGAVTLMARPEQRKAVVALGLAVDTLDAAAGALALRSKAVGPVAGAVLTGAGISGMATGIVDLVQRRNA